MTDYSTETESAGVKETKTENRIKTVKELDPDQQPREKALAHGIGALATHELWALILRTGTQGYPITDMCRDMMKSNDGKMHNLMRRSRKEIMQIPGIGITKAIQIEAVMEIVRRYQNEQIGERPVIKQPKDIWDIMRHIIGNLDHEEIWALFLNRKNEVTEKIRITSGTSIASLFDPKLIIKPALLANADGIIMCHNHPSNNMRPSPQDESITNTLRKAAELFSLRLMDHVIICADGFYSFRNEGKLD